MDIQKLSNNHLQKILQKRSNWIFFALSLLSLLPVLFLYLKFGEAGLGYDIGIYKHSILEYFHSFFDPQIPPFSFTNFSSFTLFLGETPNSTLLIWYFLLIFFTTLCFGLLIKKTTNSRVVTFFALALFSASIIQFEFFAGFYYRNLLALFLLFGTILLVEYTSTLAILPLTLLCAIHPLTAGVVFPSLFAFAIFKKSERTYLLKLLFIAGSASVLLSFQEFFRYAQTLWNFLQNTKETLAHSSEFTGQFVDLSHFFRFTLIFLPFSVIGLYQKAKQYIFWSSITFVSAITIVGNFFLFERFYVFLNIGLIFFASLGLTFLFEKFTQKKTAVFFAFFYTLFLFIAQYLYVSQKQPLISPLELKEIQSINQIIPQKSFLLTLSSYEAPWLYGFAGDYRVIAPGTLHENKWNYDEWVEFWTTADSKKRAHLLGKYDAKEIYFYIGRSLRQEKKQFFTDDPHIDQINDFLWKYHSSL